VERCIHQRAEIPVQQLLTWFQLAAIMAVYESNILVGYNYFYTFFSIEMARRISKNWLYIVRFIYCHIFYYHNDILNSLNMH
jgi:hypothetical protein